MLFQQETGSDFFWSRSLVSCQLLQIINVLPTWVIASPKEKSTPLVSILVRRGYLSRRRVYAENIGIRELETSAYYKLILFTIKLNECVFYSWNLMKKIECYLMSSQLDKLAIVKSSKVIISILQRSNLVLYVFIAVLRVTVLPILLIFSLPVFKSFNHWVNHFHFKVVFSSS